MAATSALKATAQPTSVLNVIRCLRIRFFDPHGLKHRARFDSTIRAVIMSRDITRVLVRFGRNWRDVLALLQKSQELAKEIREIVADPPRGLTRRCSRPLKDAAAERQSLGRSPHAVHIGNGVVTFP